MNSNELQGIVFDLGGVMVHLDSNPFYELWGHRKGKSVDEFVQAIEEWGMYDLWERGGCSEVEFFEAFKTWIGMPTIQLDEFRKHWNGIFPGDGEGIPEILTTLKKHYQIFVLSNTTDTHYYHLEERFSWLSQFDQVFTSFSLKSRKPEPEIFAKMLREIPIPPNRLLFIDDRKDNLDSAQKAGMKVQHCADPTQLKGVLTKWRLLE